MILQNDNGNTRLLATKSSKWALYNTRSAALNDLANIPEGTIVGIQENDYSDEPMRLYIRAQNVLSDFQPITISSTVTDYSFVMQYDGYAYVDNECTISVNDIPVSTSGGMVYAQKGERVKFSTLEASWNKGVRYYENRDYTGR